MSNFVCTLEDQVSSAGEIELTDAQLMAVFGAYDHYRSHCDSHPHRDSKKACSSKSVKIYQASREHLGFSLDLSVNLDVDIDEEEKEIWND